jgi:ABC-type uncharacterized transport system substrate-binding protein
MTTRRQLLIGLGASALIALSIPALAQPERRVRRIGYFTMGTVQSNAPFVAAFREGMSELRWVEGRDYIIDARYANVASQAGPGLAAELIATQPDLVLTPTNEGVRLLSQHTQTIPIVFAIAQDPVGNGFAATLRHPGGNATGLTTMARDLGAKRLQLLKEAFPRVAHVVLLYQPTDAGSVSQMKEIEDAAPRLGMRVTPIELRQPADIESAFTRGAALGADAYIVTQDYFMSFHRREIADRTLRSKVPAIFTRKEEVEVGGLMSYAPPWQDNFHRAAAFVDKILKGAKPGDLPIEQPTKIELVINLRTARALKLEIPQSILLRADRVIE